jgi:hypothetical protein
MNANIIDYIAWAVVIGVALYVLNSRKENIEPQEMNKFYAMVVGGVLAALLVLAFLKKGYFYDKSTQKCYQKSFGYSGYPTEDECLENEKKDLLTGATYF